MKRLVVIPLMLVATLLLAGTALAMPKVPRMSQLIHAANPSVPPEWAGLWETTDSVYFCSGEPFTSSTHLDTLCAGGEAEGEFSCTGTLTGSSWSLSCTQVTQEPPCTYTTQMTMTATRSDDSFISEATLNTTVSGPSPDCDFPEFCLRLVSRGTRIGPAPSEFCATTPTKRTTWGQLKSIYR